MEKDLERTVRALLAHAGLEPKEGDLEAFGDVLDTFVSSLKSLHAIDLAGEEIAPTFDPRGSKK
jgi:hypothetical protein